MSNDSAGSPEILKEKIFASVGKKEQFKAGETLIEEAKASDQCYYILKGTVSLKKQGASKEVAKRGKGDVIGEMTFLLGDVPGVSVVAEGPCEAYVLKHSDLVGMLTQDGLMAGQLFKTLAVTLSDRIGEASSKMRTEVVAKNAKKQEQKTISGGQSTSLNVSKYRQLFGLPKDEALSLRTTCSMRKENNALKDTTVQFGDLYVFEAHLCFDWKVFGFHKQQVLELTDVVALLKSTELPNTVEVQIKSASYELTIPEDFDAAWNIMEACRRNTQAVRLQAAAGENGNAFRTDTYVEVDEELQKAFGVDTEGGSGGGLGRRQSFSSRAGGDALSMELTEEDWNLFLSGAKQRKYKKGDYVLQEGHPTSALYQILQGSLRVELQLKDQAQAVVVGHRGAGEMFGETSLLKASNATASIVTDSDEAIVVCIEGAYLDGLFKTHPALPGRFFAFLAGYQARRLRSLTDLMSKDRHEVAGQNLAKVSIEDIFSNPAYMGIFRKFMTRTADEEPENRDTYAMSLAMFEFFMDVQDYKSEPDPSILREMGAKIFENFVKRGGPMSLACFSDGDRSEIRAPLDASSLPMGEARKVFDSAQKKAVKAIEDHCYAGFLASEHFSYILELKAKEGIVPGLPDFRLQRVLGQGGFGQVLEVVKRDCGKHYAMKVMHKEMMRRCLGSSWRKKIALEKDLMASLNHPFLVNLAYSFQNTEFLVLVMDLVPAGDLSEFVLTKKRLTPDQVRFILMEVVCVIYYCHTQMVLYRDLKPENVLIDADGHIRLIDMGLAARITKKTPLRRSRVGTDCYMAPEVRWAKERRQPYGLTCDWYTVGVLTYEFSAGTVPYAHPEDQTPSYREHDFKDPHAMDMVKGLLVQDHTQRLGCGPTGINEILEHSYWRGIEWDLVPLKKFESPCAGLKAPPKKKKDKENQAVQIATDMSEAEREPEDLEYNVGSWDHVSPTAVIEEYMENMYQCVSSI